LTLLYIYAAFFLEKFLQSQLYIINKVADSASWDMTNKQTLGLESKRKVSHNSHDDVCFCSIYYFIYGSALKAYTLDASYGSSTCPEVEVTKIIWMEV
jgi:hypothetical protein